MTRAVPPSDPVRVARALADPTRFELLRAIAARAELSCQELTALFPVTQATISHHLRVLSEAGLVTVRAEGTYHRYRVVPGALSAYAGAVEALADARSLAPKPSHAARRKPRKEQHT